MQNVREAITNLLMNGVDRAYDTDLAAAFLVKDAMRKRGFRFSLMQWDPNDADVTWAQFERFSDHPSGAAAFGEAEGTDIPRTICEAALDALEAEREHGAAVDDARAMSGEYVMPPQVAALLRSGAATVPRAPERNWDALIEAARRKPRTDDDVLREKFGGGGTENRPKVAVTATPVEFGEMPDAAPSSDLDPYEPIGTMPIVGDRVMKVDWSGNAEPSYWSDNRVTAISGDWVSVGHVRSEGFSIKFAGDRLVRILKRKAPTPQVPQADAPSQPFYYTPNGIVALGSNTARFAEYTLTYYNTNTGGSGSIVLGGGAVS